MIALLILTWAVLSFLLHNLLHEGAHALVALIDKASPIKLWPFPGRRLGYWSWAHMTHGLLSGSTALRWLLFAPVIAELIWSVPWLFASWFSASWCRALIAIELTYSCVDITTWLLGVWTNRSHSDSVRLRNSFGWSAIKAKTLSLLFVIYFLIVGAFIVRMFT